MTNDKQEMFELNHFNDLVQLIDLDNDEEFEDSPYTNIVNECKYFEPHDFACEGYESKTCTSFFHLNCRGLSTNWDNFYELVNSLHNTEFTFDFIGISESFYCEYDTRLQLPGYHELIKTYRDNDNRGGVALFIKDSIHYNIRTDISVFIPNIFETIFVEYEDEKHTRSIIGIVYRPNTPPKADFDIFSANMSDIMEIINKEKKRAIIMGDMNVDLLKFRDNVTINSYLDLVFSNGFFYQ